MCYSPFSALASIRRHLPSSLSSACLLQPPIPRTCDVSLQVISSHLVLHFFCHVDDKFNIYVGEVSDFNRLKAKTAWRPSHPLDRTRIHCVGWNVFRTPMDWSIHSVLVISLSLQMYWDTFRLHWIMVYFFPVFVSHSQ